MPAIHSRIVVRGNERAALPQAHIAHALSPDEQLEVTLRLRPKTPPAALPNPSAAGRRATRPTHLSDP
ncbi:MAG: hypothetical protein WKG07_22855 [Hymenobacter sp.]